MIIIIINKNSHDILSMVLDRKTSMKINQINNKHTQAMLSKANGNIHTFELKINKKLNLKV